MKNLPEVFVDYNWNRTVNYILYKMENNKEFILKAKNNKILKTALESVLNILNDGWKKKKRWLEDDEIKIHLVKR